MVREKAKWLRDVLDRRLVCCLAALLLSELETKCRLECARGTGICRYRKDADA